MYYEGQRTYFSHVAIGHSQAYIITDLCWQEQIVSTKEGGISFCYLLCATKKLWQDPVKTVTTPQQIIYAMLKTETQSVLEESLLYSMCWTK